MSTALLHDTRLVLQRELRPLLSEPFSVLFSLVQPLFFLALFGPLLVSVSGLGEAASLQWFVPSILVMSALFGASTTGANLTQEIHSGSHERMLVTPLARPSLLMGRALKEIVPSFELPNWFAIYAPAGLAPEVVSKMSDALNRIADMPDVQERALAMGLKPIKDTPQDAAAELKKQYAVLGELVKKLNIKTE